MSDIIYKKNQAGNLFFSEISMKVMAEALDICLFLKRQMLDFYGFDCLEFVKTSSQKLGRHALHRVCSVWKSLGWVGFGSKKFFGSKTFFGSKSFFGQKRFFGSKKNFGSKMFFWVKKVFWGQKKVFWVKKNFWVKIVFWVKKVFLVKKVFFG